MNIPLLGTGLTGLVGSKFVELYQEKYACTNLDLATGVDITDAAQVMDAIVKHPASVVVHFAAFTDVTKAHQENGDREGMVYKVNVRGTKHIVDAVKQAGKRLIHISTAYVFDGEKPTPYTEEDSVHPIEWYGQTKAYAEEQVLQADINAVILRIDQPYRLDEFPKLDILHRIKKGLEEKTLPPMFTDHTFCPTRIEQFAQTLDFMIHNDVQGIFHATTDPMTTDYEFAQQVKQQFGLAGEIQKGSLEEFLKTTSRPYQKNTALDTTKLQTWMA